MDRCIGTIPHTEFTVELISLSPAFASKVEYISNSGEEGSGGSSVRGRRKSTVQRDGRSRGQRWSGEPIKLPPTAINSNR